jgi:hypothetical protein
MDLVFASHLDSIPEIKIFEQAKAFLQLMSLKARLLFFSKELALTMLSKAQLL